MHEPPDFPPGTKFYDIDWRPVAEFPDRTCIAYSEDYANTGCSAPFPYTSPGFQCADTLTRDEFIYWLRTGEGVWAKDGKRIDRSK